MNTTTLIVLGSVAIALIGYDIWAYFQGTQWSISYNCYQLAKRYPIFAFALGVVCGHLLWVQCGACG